MSYTESFTVKTRDCDVYGHWRPSSILEEMQEVAVSHLESEGLGRAVTDGLGVVWVLSRCRVELSRMPEYGDEVSLETFALPMKHLFFPRAHVLRDPEGTPIGGSLGFWLLMDVKTRRAVRPEYIAERLPAEAQTAPVRSPLTVRALNDTPEAIEILPRYTEFDLNGHVNNARYLDWCWNALGFEGLGGKVLSSFDVNYDGEILPSRPVRGELCREGNAFSFCGFLGDRRSFGISGALRDA